MVVFLVLVRLGFLVLGVVVFSPGGGCFFSPGDVGFFSLGGGCLQSCCFFHSWGGGGFQSWGGHSEALLTVLHG